MPKRAISAALSTLTLTSTLVGCQLFTAKEQVSDPDLGRARAFRTSLESASGQNHKAKEVPVEPQVQPAAEAAETATASHILIRYVGTMRAGPEVTRSKEEAKKLADQIAAKAASGADFAELADQYTEDPSGKGRGGRLGTFGRNRMVPEFDKAVFALSPGQSSGVIETAFGYHIIHREK